MEYFIGLTFDPGSIHYKKIESFRKRFDPKFEKAEVLQLTILPPFSVDFQRKEDETKFVEELTELLEGHLYGLDALSQMEFNGITFSMGKKGVLSLTPIISPDILHCQESLYFFLKEYGVKFNKSKNAGNPLLPIGRFEFTDSMEATIETAKIEFSSPFVMVAESFVLFLKTPREWKNKNNLFDFDNRNHFFFVNQLYA
ncbi:hypothetical protein C0V70_10325 [Bacteriovorax stolpii]|uniref:Uncharacterized protein n=1 Tax=Bacteriovorax stolpii TaxID=960 RepID=A0A2K9NUQ7_BACTC|nr:hypothetical protein [Bacteriovorax stolpii]AUN98494.1 hypothetical protein C0V70_10325 [Bacteriovorax stolpii]TDP50881.1 hypothetical protein C8D79_3618 [Bacteriovorax stolpii]